jgi:1,4-alpha-glucan branching enzyme
MRDTGHTAFRVFVLVFIAACAISCGRYLEKSIDSPSLGDGAVTFRVKAPAARTVQIAGDWPRNNWARGDAEEGEVLVGLMSQTGKGGVWEITVPLDPGRYRYRFLIDESQWLLDPENPRIVSDGQGGKANLLIVP